MPRARENEIIIHTDGSCHPNPDGDGGWGFVMRYGDKHARRFGPAERTTNNEMELEAIRRALLFVRPGGSETLDIRSDSNYCVQCLTKWHKGWARQGWITGSGTPVRNVRLIKEILWLLKQHRKSRTVNLRWLKGHAGTQDNEIADGLAGNARIAKDSNWSDDKDLHFTLPEYDDQNHDSPADPDPEPSTPRCRTLQRVSKARTRSGSGVL